MAKELLPRCAELWNLYGPTETTIWSTCERVTATSLESWRSGSVSLGRPIANTRLYVVDGTMQLVPVGVPGELCIGGDGVARGYVQRLDLTEERFVQDPFRGRTDRMYRTGDRVRYRADGRLEFLGRIDHQVKVRGYRIELGEIETVLSEHPEVKQAIVVPVDTLRSEDRRLAAYVVPKGPAIEVVALRSLLQERLPDYMTPSVIHVVDSMPLTPNGKVDRRGLAERHVGALPRTAYEPPANGVAQVIARIWQEVLGIERIGARDNFYEIGGHSLRLALVRSRLNAALGRDVSMLDLVRHPTIAALATCIEGPANVPRSFEKARERAARQARAMARSRPHVRGDR